MDGGGIQEVRGGTPGADDGEEPKLRSACDNCSVKKIKVCANRCWHVESKTA